MKSLRNTILQEIVTEIENEYMKVEKNTNMGLKLELLKNTKFHSHGLLEILLIIIDVKPKTLWLMLLMVREMRLGVGLRMSEK